MSQTTLSEYEVRLQKLHDLKAAGVIPYANKFDRTASIQELKEKQSSSDILSDSELLMKTGAKDAYSLAGRLMTWRTHGRLSFGTIRDGSSDIQIAFVRDLCHFHTGREIVDEIEITENKVSAYKFVDRFFDIGDFVGVRGELFVTKHGELTLFVNEYQMLSKALRPLGDKRHGIKDEEKQYRQRYLDMTMNEETYERFKLRSKFIKSLREFYWSNDFIELETPILGNSASGAAAQPFITHHNDFDTDFFLRIATETALKKATVGRFERVFEIGKQFRNEGSDPSHLQEFTSVEHYGVYRNYEDNMKFTEDMFAYLLEKCGIDSKVSVKDKQGNINVVDFSGSRDRIDYVKGIQEASGINIEGYGMDDADTLRSDIKTAGHERVGMNDQGTTTLIDYLYKKVLRPKILGPAFVYNYPKAMQPLARQNDTNPNLVEQFQVVVNGREIIKAYSELVDPLIQSANFEEQSGALEAGDEEATSGDDDFVLAMEYGMPCQSGRGMGIDRIIALLTQQDNLRDQVMFPLMKDEQKQTTTEETVSIQEHTTRSSTLENALETGATLAEYMIPGFDSITAVVDEYLTDTRRHCEQVGQVMKYFAKKLNQDEELRYAVGILHDIDRDHISKDPENHLGDQFDAIMDKVGADDHLRRVIRSHYPDGTGIQPESLIEKYLISVDELSGFLYAYSLMRPEGFDGMKRKSINKKLKDRKFAAGVDREHVRSCEVYLDMPLNEFALEVIEGLKMEER